MCSPGRIFLIPLFAVVVFSFRDPEDFHARSQSLLLASRSRDRVFVCQAVEPRGDDAKLPFDSILHARWIAIPTHTARERCTAANRLKSSIIGRSYADRYGQALRRWCSFR